MSTEMNAYVQKHIEEVLAKAREIYSSKNQILVCIEELNELACVLAKYPRYTSEQDAKIALHKKVLDEVADVEIILNHVKAIFELNQEELTKRKVAKVERVSRWLSESSDMQITVDDRAVIPEGCSACWYEYNPDSPTCNVCNGEDPCYHA